MLRDPTYGEYSKTAIGNILFDMSDKIYRVHRDPAGKEFIELDSKLTKESVMDSFEIVFFETDFLITRMFLLIDKFVLRLMDEDKLDMATPGILMSGNKGKISFIRFLDREYGKLKQEEFRLFYERIGEFFQ